MSDSAGDYAICRVEPQEDSDGLFHTLAWGYDSEAQAIAALRRVSEENHVEIEDIAIIKTIMSADLKEQGLLPA